MATQSMEKNPLFRITDRTSYLFLPIVVNFQKQCDQNGTKTSYQAWVLNNNLQLKNPMSTINNVNTAVCIYHCRATNGCQAISRDNSQNETSSDCLLFNKIDASETNTKYKSYFLKYCLLNFYSTEEPQLNIPILFHPEEMCHKELLLQNDLTKCQSKSWHMQENVALSTSPFRAMNNTELFVCLNECIKESTCQAIVVENVVPFESVCYFYNNIKNDEIHKNGGKTLYKMICCSLQKMPADYSSNLLLLNQLSKYCAVNFHSTDPTTCAPRVWHVNDNMRRLSGNFTISSLTTVNECLHLCLTLKTCRYVSVDFYEQRCLYFHKDIYSSIIVGQAKWTTFQLECCKDLESKVGKM